ncbi:MAG: DUF3021 domain-containing protein [Ruminococcaceae bacterium]|nr:DUF3021 domain-containing protein [Oscillospiraceae bacterium]
MKNQYEQLKKENTLRAECLSEKSRDELARLDAYLKATTWNVYEAQLTKKEVIGMALSLEKDGKTLEDEIGQSRDEFYDGIKNNLSLSTFMDYLCTDGYVVSLIVLGFMLLQSAAGGFFSQQQITVHSIVWLFFVYPIFYFVDKFLRRRMTYKKFKKTGTQDLLGFSIFAAVFIIWLIIILRVGTVPLFSIQNVWLIAIFTAICAAIYIIKYRYYARLADEKPWKD